MDIPTPGPHILRFGVFELDCDSGELRRHGRKVRLPDQSFQILRLLLARPAQIVTREELRRLLWTADTFVDFDVGLNSAIRKLREALGDSAENPRFVETLPRRGYRFIAPVNAPTADPLRPPDADGRVTARVRVQTAWMAGGLALVATLAVVWLLSGREGFVGQRTGLTTAPIRLLGARDQRTVDPQAYKAYLAGMVAAGSQRYEGQQTAVEYFEAAIARQPDFAEAYTALAQNQLQFLFGGPLSPRDVIPKAEAAARKAIQLDDRLAQAHRTLGQILSLYHWKWDEADREYRRAAALSAGSAEPAATAGTSLIRQGRVAEAVAVAERARALDPLSFAAQMNAGTAYRAAGQHDRAISEFRRALDMSPEHPRAHFQRGATYVAMGRLQDAIRDLETAARSPQGRNWRFEAYLGYAYAAAGRTVDARSVLKELEARRREQYVSSFGIALIHDALGEKQLALGALERAHEDHAVEFGQMTQYPPFRAIASEPRFQAVMRQIGLPR